MAHLSGKLSVREIESLQNSGRYGDGMGLYLVVTAKGSKSWILRTVIKGKRTDIGLGGLSYTSLQDARRKALELRAVARNGGDPRFGKQKAIPSFAELANEVYRDRLPTWKNPKHAAQWLTSLENYAFEEIGAQSVDTIDSNDVLRILQPIWTEKQETARRVMQRIGVVLDYAKARKFRGGENPVLTVKALGVLPKVKASQKHHGAMPWQELPAFYAELVTRDATAALALRFTILTASRTSEVLNATWSEIDGALWTRPAERMKGNIEHAVPLPNEALAVLEAVKGVSEHFVFEGQRRNHPLSNMAMETLLRRMGVKESGVTVHGFRSTFRDWASDAAKAPRELAEAALAHNTLSKTERAYARSSHLERRANLMERWSSFVTGEEAKIVRLG
jgi:integrase